jgi:hypothetical protein
MTCHNLRDDAGRPIGIYCTRERKRRCYTCQAPNASLSCDGCDHVLCTCCAVSPKQGLDFCPACAREAWLFFWRSAQPEGDRAARRQAFRLWAREQPEKFLELARPRTKASVREVPTTMEGT